MNKSKVYLTLVGAITALVVWDMADSFFGGLGFPRGDWEAYTWQLPFVLLANGRRFRVLNIVDDFTRECVGQLIETSISGLRMSRFLENLNRKPKVIVCDNGPELTSKAMFFWARDRSIKLHFIQPGKPTQNAFVESFNGKFRDYCLNLHWFRSLEEARFQIDTWRKHCNEERPHGSLGRLTPTEFAEQVA